MMTPGPDHPITIAPAGKRWRARFAGHVIADSVTLARGARAMICCGDRRRRSLRGSRGREWTFCLSPAW